MTTVGYTTPTDTMEPRPRGVRDNVHIQERMIGDSLSREVTLLAAGLPGYHVGIPATADKRTDLVALLRRLADNIEAGK